jgi:hypothetical protein
MHIEDLIILIASRVQMNPFDSKLIYSFQDQIFRGNGFTEKQATLAIKILRRQKAKLEQITGKDIGQFLDNPSFRLSKRTVNNNKRLSIEPNGVYGKIIKAEFPFNEELVQSIRETRAKLHFAQWDKEEKAWIFSLDERSLKFLMSVAKKYEFLLDEEVENFFNQIEEIEQNIENHIPIVSMTENVFKFKNISDRVPQPDTSDVFRALFEARKVGIQTWDETVDAEMKKNGCEKAVLDFLEVNPSQPYEFLLENHSLFEIQNIVKYLTPCIFVIPGGSELEKVELSLELLKNVGIDNSEVSVLFRLPKETGENFNNFVKNNLLNNPINDNTKAIFISSKIPKTIIEPKIKFNSVVNFNFYSVHYTIREFLKNHHNVIHVMDKKPQRNINFAFL